MTTYEKMNRINENAAAVAMANEMLTNANREMSLSEIVEIVYSKFFN